MQRGYVLAAPINVDPNINIKNQYELVKGAAHPADQREKSMSPIQPINGGIHEVTVNGRSPSLKMIEHNTEQQLHRIKRYV